MSATHSAYGYKCVDCDRVWFAFVKELPKSCPYCQCPSVMRLKERVEVIIHEAEPSQTD